MRKYFLERRVKQHVPHSVFAAERTVLVLDSVTVLYTVLLTQYVKWNNLDLGICIICGNAENRYVICERVNITRQLYCRNNEIFIIAKFVSISLDLCFSRDRLLIRNIIDHPH